MDRMPLLILRKSNACSITKATEVLWNSSCHPKRKMAPTTPETAKAAADMKKKDVKDFASTKHKGLPKKKSLKEFLENI